MMMTAPFWHFAKGFSSIASVYGMAYEKHVAGRCQCFTHFWRYSPGVMPKVLRNTFWK